MVTIYESQIPQSESAAFVRRILREYHGATGELLRTPQGKPYLAQGPFFNLAHSCGRTALAVSDKETGLDMELRRPRALPALYARLSEKERREDFFTLWTAKEAYIKYRGGTIAALLPRLRYEGELLLDGVPAPVRLSFFEREGALLCLCTASEESVRFLSL